MEWDDLRYFLELARVKTLTEAARRLEVKHTTVSRRVQRLEIATGAPLFTRSKNGYSLTLQGEALLSIAQSIEDQFSCIDTSSEKTDENVTGVVRVGCVEGYAVGSISSQIPAFLSGHPGLSIDLIVQPRPIHLSRNEADIVITLDRPERGPYTITKLCDYNLKLYAAPEYLQHNEPIYNLSDLKKHRFIGYLGETGPAKDLPSITDLVPGANVSLRSTSIFSQLAAVSCGGGIGLLPGYLAADYGLQPILSETVSFQRTYWMLMPLELRRITRMRVVWDFLKSVSKSETSKVSL